MSVEDKKAKIRLIQIIPAQPDMAVIFWRAHNDSDRASFSEILAYGLYEADDGPGYRWNYMSPITEGDMLSERGWQGIEPVIENPEYFGVFHIEDARRFCSKATSYKDRVAMCHDIVRPSFLTPTQEEQK
jgi:hypothetical protein